MQRFPHLKPLSPHPSKARVLPRMKRRSRTFVALQSISFWKDCEMLFSAIIASNKMVWNVMKRLTVWPFLEFYFDFQPIPLPLGAWVKVMVMVMTMTKTKTHKKTNTKKKTDIHRHRQRQNTKCFQDPMYAIFFKSRGFKDIKYCISSKNSPLLDNGRPDNVHCLAPFAQLTPAPQQSW